MPETLKLIDKISMAETKVQMKPLVCKAAEIALRAAVNRAVIGDETHPVSAAYVIPGPNAKAKSMVVTAVANIFNVRVLGDARLVATNYSLSLIGYDSAIRTVKAFSDALLAFAEAEAERQRAANPDVHGKSFKQGFYTEFGVELAEMLTTIRQDCLGAMRPSRAMAFARREAAVQEKLAADFGRRRRIPYHPPMPANGKPTEGVLLTEASLQELVAELQRRVTTGTLAEV